jgi:uncharacterized damage-inducible protein DinB
MSVDAIIASWREVRAGLIDEASQISADGFSFKPTEEMRSVAGLLQHLIETQKFLVSEACVPDTNLMRHPFGESFKFYAPGVRDINDKDALLDLLRASMDEAETKLREAANEMKNTMKRFDGEEITKQEFLSFTIAHEMYHRGQLTVYERLLGIEPMLTQRFRKAFGKTPA